MSHSGFANCRWEREKQREISGAIHPYSSDLADQAGVGTSRKELSKHLQPPQKGQIGAVETDTDDQYLCSE